MQAPVSERPAVSGATYLYAIASSNMSYAENLPGIGDHPVFPVTRGGVTALVSEAPPGRIRPERRNLAAHHEILRRLMEHDTILPVTFGVVADDAAALERLLDTNQELFREQLDKVKGKVEFSVRVSWSVPNIFEYFVERFAELREMRDALVQKGATQDDRIALGRLFESLLSQEREGCMERVEKVLHRRSHAIRRNPPRSENEVMNLACLVGRGEMMAFEAAVMEAARPFDESFSFTFSGPWAPHNFVELVIEV